MVMLGCKPQGRVTEQHDIFFGIGNSLKDLIPQMDRFWLEAEGKLHIDAWREVTSVDGYGVEIVPKTDDVTDKELFFINLGGYRPGEFEEYHYKILSVAQTLADASKKAKDTAFYKHCGFSGAVSHVDDKYGIDVDDICNVEDILPQLHKEKYSLELTENTPQEDTLHIGYVSFSKI